MSFTSSTRREFLKSIGTAAISAGVFAKCSNIIGENILADRRRPNIILILTDDQGYGDVGFHGNKIIKTPNLDRLAREGIDLTRFYVAPVCSPTRAGIMTGRYHYRTGVTNVGSCGDRIKAREVTIAQSLFRAGYATAIYGKWHLGDNYPMRPQDNGFEETIIHKGCCLTPWFRNNPPGENYFDPYLFHNSEKKKYNGYCMDVYTDLAIEFAKKNCERDKPFFIYLSTNTPHGPLNVSEKYSGPYKKMGLSDYELEYYGTIANIDYNIGRLRSKLKNFGLDDNTLIIFLTDNGASGGNMKGWPQKLRGRKASVYEGGIRVPCVFHWPGIFEAGVEMDRIAAYTDLMPTVLDVAGIAPPEGVKLDGVSLMSVLTDQQATDKERTIIIQWHQGLNPQLFRSFAIFNQRFKLVQAVGGFHNSGKFLTNEYKYELFDISKDPLEKNDISSEYPEVVSEMKQQYEDWFWDVMKSRGPDPQEIYIGSPHENPTKLMANASFVEQDEIPNYITGEWPSRVLRTGKYDVTLFFHKGLKSNGILSFSFRSTNLKEKVKKGITQFNFKDVHLEKGSDWLHAGVLTSNTLIIPTYIDIKFKEN